MSLKLTLLAAGGLLAATATGASAQGISEQQARSALWNECNNPSELSHDAQGNWHGYCSKGAVMVTAQGKVVSRDPGDQGARPAGVSQRQAMSALWNECNNVSTLNEDYKGNWHGYCSKGAMMVNAQGKVVPDDGTFIGLTEAHARSIAWDNCANVSSLARDGDGNYHGYCSKGPITITKDGKFQSP